MLSIFKYAWIFLCVFAWLSLAFAADPPPEVLRAFAPYQRLLDEDRNYTIEDYLNRRDLAEGPVQILVWDIPESQVTQMGLQGFRIQKNGQFYVRVPVRDVTKVEASIYSDLNKINDQKNLITRMKKQFGEPNLDYWGIKKKSHNTYLVVNVKNPKENPQELKFQIRKFSRYDPKKNKYFYEDRGNSGRVSYAVRLSHYLKSIMGLKSRHTFLPEDSAITIDLPEVKSDSHLNEGSARSYSVLSRTLIPYGKEVSVLESGHEPLHVLLGTDQPHLTSIDDLPKLTHYAKLRGMSNEEWIFKEYLPKFTKFLSEMHHLKGVYPEAHTQNIVVEINPKTGELGSFFFRDLFDTIVDPSLVIEKPIAKGLLQSLIKLNDLDPFWEQAPRAQQAGHNVYHFATQSVESFFPMDRDDQKNRAISEFLDQYVKHSEEISGVKITLSEKSLKAMDYFKKSKKPRSQFTERVRPTVAGVVQEVYDQVVKSRFFKKLQDQGISISPEDLENAQALFKAKMKAKDFFWLKPGAKSKLQRLFSFLEEPRFAFVRSEVDPDQFRMYVWDQKSGSPMGITDWISKAELETAHLFPKIPYHSKMKCLKEAL